jgi:hypothetical protein
VWTRVNRKPPSCEEQARMIAEKRWSVDVSAWPALGAEQTPPVAQR